MNAAHLDRLQKHFTNARTNYATRCAGWQGWGHVARQWRLAINAVKAGNTERADEIERGMPSFHSADKMVLKRLADHQPKDTGYPLVCVGCGRGCDAGLEDNHGRPRCEDCDQALQDDCF